MVVFEENVMYFSKILVEIFFLENHGRTFFFWNNMSNTFFLSFLLIQVLFIK